MQLNCKNIFDYF